MAEPQAPDGAGSSPVGIERMALDAAGIGLCRCTLDGTIVDIDRATLRFVGLPDADPAEFRGKPVGHGVPAALEYLDKAAPLLEALSAQGRIEHLEVPVPTADGQTTWVLLDAFVVDSLDGGAPAVQFVLRDITPRKQAQNGLAESSALLQATVESIPFDLFALDCEGRYVLQNSACREHWGDVLGKRPDELGYSERMVALWLDNNRRALAGEVVRGEEVLDLLGDRQQVVYNVVGPIRNRGEITGVLGVNVDITERKQAEQRYRELYANVPVGVFRGSADGQLLAANPAVVRIMGYASSAELRQVPMAEIFAEDHARRELMGRLRDEEEVTDFEIQLCRKDGSVLWTSVSATPVRDDEGRTLHFDGILQDISASKQMEEQLRQVAKMEAIGRLAGGIAHDFNNLLTAILGQASLLRRRFQDDDSAMRSASTIEQAAERAHELTQQLLGFARKGKYRREAVELHQTIEEVRELLSRTIDRRIRIDLALDAEQDWVIGDPSQLHQAVLNLALNARDAMPDGGELTISTRNSGEEGSPLQLELRVEDTGDGIPAELQERIFEPFFTTKDGEGGAGMGLAMVYGIAEHHGGSIEVSDRPGGGTAFVLRLPTTRASTRPAPRPTPKPPPGLGGVLVVDDEQLVRKVTANLLSALGYEVFLAASGEEALELYRQHRGRIGVVLLDLMMPEMDGRQCAHRLRKLDPGVHILFSTGYALDESAQEALDTGAAGFISKPYTYDQLGEAVRKALRS